MTKEDIIWEFRKACLNDDIEKIKEISFSHAELMKKENPDNLDLNLLSKSYQIQHNAYTGDFDKIKALIEENPNLINQSWSAEAWSPLHQATPVRSIKIFRYLIGKGANIHFCSKAEGTEGYSILHATAWEGNQEAAKILIDLGVNVNVRNADGVTPLIIAKRRKHESLITFLLGSGAED